VEVAEARVETTAEVQARDDLCQAIDEHQRQACLDTFPFGLLTLVFRMI
jgi:hypothetical protein